MTTHRIQPVAPRDRRGMALVLALGAIIVIGILVGGAFFVSTRDVRTGRTAKAQEVAQLRAELALNAARESLTISKPTFTANGQMYVYSWPTMANEQARVTLTKMNDAAYLLTASGRGFSGSSAGSRDTTMRRATMAMQLKTPTMNFPGALTVRGNTTIGGSSLIQGADANPTGWSECPPPGASMPGVVIGSATQLNYNGCNNGNCVQGNPPVQPNAIANQDATYFEYGNTTWDDIKQYATQIPPRTYSQIGPRYRADGSCDASNLENWGDPVRGGQTACEQFFRIMYVPGDLSLSGGIGQGVLLVEGDLQVQGGFEFYGPVIVKGHLRTFGTGGHFNGGVMAANVDLEQNTVLGDALISFSSCAIATALRGSAPLIPARQRAWADLY